MTGALSMVSRSNFFVITSIMIIILVMFQFTEVSEDVVLRNAENVNLDKAYTDEQRAELRDAYEQRVSALTSYGDKSEVALIGDENDLHVKEASEWCENQKRIYRIYKNLSELTSGDEYPDFLIMDGRDITSYDGELIKRLGEENKTLVVSNVPDVSVLQSDEKIRSSFGIIDIKEKETELEGMTVFSGFLLGGETHYSDFPLKIPYFGLNSSVKVFAVGKLDDEKLLNTENEDMPPVIWRSYNDTGMLYAVNCGFLESRIGEGILTAIAADASPEYIYPIVNAQISVAENYPLLADENGETMKSLYGRDSVSAVRDVVWPVIAGIYYDTGEEMTAVCSPRLDYSSDSKLSESLMQYYYQQITKMKGEIGISGFQVSSVPLEEKLQKDFELFDSVLPNYVINTFYAGDLDESVYGYLLEDGRLLENINVVLKDYSENTDLGLFRYSGGAMEIMMYMESDVHEDADDLRFKCLQTAYGFYASAIDASRIIYPKSDSDYWNNMSEKWSSTFRPYRIIFDYFDKMTAAEADCRIRNYLALDYKYERNEDTINLKADSYDYPCYFILCLHGEQITDIQGGTAEKLEEDRYMLTVTEPEAVIYTEQSEKALYY